MAIEKVRAYFEQFGLQDSILEFPVSSATVELAAEAVGVEGARIAKSLTFMVEEKPIVLVTAGDMKIYNGAYKRYFGTKAKMLTAQQVHDLVGHDVGGVCPFGIPNGVKTYLDVSLKRFETVFPAAGSSNSAIELSPADLEKYSENFVDWVDVCKPIE